MPIGIATLAEVGIYLGATIYAASLAVTDAAAHSVAIRLAGIGYAFYFGLQQAAMTRLARTGPKSERGRQVMGTAMVLDVGVGLWLCGSCHVNELRLPCRHLDIVSADADTKIRS